MDRIGRYQIKEELGRGAMGVVFLATDPTIDRSVAIKTIRLGEVTNPAERTKLQERLFREARSAGKLSHPGIVTIYDMEEQGDVAYIAMEFVDGSTLDELLSEPESIEPDKVLDILRQTATALDYAHRRGIVHRDIKPANIMINPEGKVKITDFGIAKLASAEQFTMTGTIVGTPNYMSPEQVQGQPVDGRADQFSLAVVAYEILTGEKPFGGENLSTVVYKIVAEEPVAPHRLNPTLGPKIESVLSKGLAKKPDERYLSCSEFVAALEEACAATKGWKNLSRGGSLELPTVAGSAQPAAPAPAVQQPFKFVERSPMADRTVSAERRRFGVLPMLLGILVAAGLVGVIAWQATPWLTGGHTPAQETSAPEPDMQQNATPPLPPAPSQTTPSVASMPGATEQRPSPLGPPEQASGQTVSSAPKPEGQVSGPETAAASDSGAPAPNATSAKSAQTQPAEATSVTPPGPSSKTGVESAQAKPSQPRPNLRQPTPPPTKLRDIWVNTIPGGANALLDGSTEMSCVTPCMLEAAPGDHTITVTMNGFQAETRTVKIGDGPVELPLIRLHQPGGTLMLASEPDGATIYVNGRQWPQRTPARLDLAAGNYKITVEKNGQRATQEVEIRARSTRLLRVVLGQ